MNEPGATTSSGGDGSVPSALECVSRIALHHGLNYSVDKLRHELAASEGASAPELINSAIRLVGLKFRAKQTDLESLARLDGVFPLIARLRNGNYVIVIAAGTDDKQQRFVAVLDPLAEPRNVVLRLDGPTFDQAWSGEIILLKREYAWSDEDQPFGLRWFLPEILRNRSLFRDVAVAALAMHFLALAVPIFMQLVIDKVIVHQGYSTLMILTIGVVIALMFDAAFGFMRQFLLVKATNRIDMHLAESTFSKLMKLPIQYFETMTAGVITRHMQQAEKIRHFLTGRLFLTILDASVLVIFLPVLFAYSAKLALIVLLFAALIGAVVFFLIGPYRTRLQALYNAEAERQALLVETIQGMRTVKSLSIEPSRRRDWEKRSARSIRMQFGVAKISVSAHAAMTFLEKLMMVTLIAVGTHDVFDQQLTIGAMIAFNMLSGRVVSPLVQIVSLVNEYQETALSIRMLGEIMNRPSEGGRTSGGLEPQVQGKIEFEGVTFRYAPVGAPALDRITFGIPSGKVVGVVGRSGSGKTTLTRLIQGLYPIQEGVVRIDGVDIREIDLGHLRRNIGVVLQESFLIRGTVRENISVTKPSAAFEDIVRAAQNAGADEFIERLPQGYDTLLEENGANLSGGQKQRLAIARALLADPKILILDEAASSLDPESEAIFLENLGKLTANRTVIIVSHRLSTLTRADAIMVFNRGQIVDAGTHQQLIGRCQIYAHLWKQQTKHL